MLLEMEYIVQFSKAILRKIWNAMRNQYNININKYFCKNKQMQILTIIVFYNQIFSNTII